MRTLRFARLLRAIALLVVGLFIAFTATFHEQIAFDVSAALAGLTIIGVVTAVEYWVLRGTPESWWVAARAVIAFAAAGALLAVTDSAGLALVIALWAVLTGVVTVMRLVRRVQPTRVAVPSLLLSFALAIAVLLVRSDPVAVIGLFGAYAVIRGVFLGISAFDTREEVEAAVVAADQPTETPSTPDKSND